MARERRTGNWQGHLSVLSPYRKLACGPQRERVSTTLPAPHRAGFSAASSCWQRWRGAAAGTARAARGAERAEARARGRDGPLLSGMLDDREARLRQLGPSAAWRRPAPRGFGPALRGPIERRSSCAAIQHAAPCAPQCRPPAGLARSAAAWPAAIAARGTSSSFGVMVLRPWP